MGIDETVVEEIVRKVLAVVSPVRIILFGSAARGEMTADSDIDLLIVEENVSTDRRKQYLTIRRALKEMNYPFDVILISRQWFEDSKDVIGGVAYPANKYGKVIYEAA